MDVRTISRDKDQICVGLCHQRKYLYRNWNFSFCLFRFNQVYLFVTLCMQHKTMRRKQEVASKDVQAVICHINTSESDAVESTDACAHCFNQWRGSAVREAFSASVPTPGLCKQSLLNYNLLPKHQSLRFKPINPLEHTQHVSLVMT